MKALGIALVVLLVIVAAALWPLAWIWSLNALFALTIPFTFKTWLAALILSVALIVRNSNK